LCADLLPCRFTAAILVPVKASGATLREAREGEQALDLPLKYDEDRGRIRLSNSVEPMPERSFIDAPGQQTFKVIQQAAGEPGRRWPHDVDQEIGISPETLRRVLPIRKYEHCPRHVSRQRLEFQPLCSDRFKRAHNLQLLYRRTMGRSGITPPSPAWAPAMPRGTRAPSAIG
jgi:hypothetical protein